MPDERARSRPGEPAEPWRSFLRELDAALTGTVELRCLGGFVVAQHYGVGRETSDIDFLTALIQSQDDDLERLAGLGSALYRKFRLYLQRVGVVTPPCDYESRLVRMFPSAPWQRLELFCPRCDRPRTLQGGAQLGPRPRGLPAPGTRRTYRSRSLQDALLRGVAAIPACEARVARQDR